MAIDAEPAKPASTTMAEAGPAGQERRRSQRHLCNGFAEVHLLDRDTMFRGEIRNLSLHGCFVATRARVHLEKWGPVTLRFNLQDRLYKTEGEMVNIDPGVGIGFVFRHPSEIVARDFRLLVENHDAAAPSKPTLHSASEEQDSGCPRCLRA